MNELLTQKSLALQRALIKITRTGDFTEIEGAKNENLHHYRRLIRNIFADTLETAYPITFNLLSNQEWNLLIDEYLATFNVQSHEVWKMPYEFYQFVEESSYHLKLNRPYLLELLYFEWVEIELYTMEDHKREKYNPEINLANDKIYFCQEFQLMNFEYPVHKASKENISKKQDEFYILAFRHPNDLDVRFIEISPLWAYAIELINEQSLRYPELCDKLSFELNLNDRTQLEDNLYLFLNELKNQGFILGSLYDNFLEEF